jgi:hypothetical protein
LQWVVLAVENSFGQQARMKGGLSLLGLHPETSAHQTKKNGDEKVGWDNYIRIKNTF